MIVFFGLGNNEAKYLKTKHNAGRVVLENLAQTLGLTFQKGDKYSFCKTKWQNTEVLLVYSNGYMNLSGEALASFLSYFKIKLDTPDDFLVVLQDDSDQKEGSNKFVLAGGSAGHRGINSIYKHIFGFGLDLSRLWKLKIGIRPELNTHKSETFVLSQLSSQDDQNLKKLNSQILNNREWFSSFKWDKIQNLINTKASN